MRKSFNHRLKRQVYELFAGDYYATNEKGAVLTTLLGSCVSVCLKDETTGVVGMNHFMLPSTIRLEEIIFSEDARYGILSMEKMINNMMKLGANRKRLKAKVFGGGRIMDSTHTDISSTNADFAKIYLQMEDIPILSSDLGGDYGRKLFFFAESFTIYMKKIPNKRVINKTLNAEKDFLRWIKNEQDQESDVTFFDGNGGKE